MTPELTIVVPAFNETPRLGDGMRRFEVAVTSGAIDLETTEVVLVDDGSTDATESTARKLLAPLPNHRVVRHPVNRGKGAAVRTGIALATGACVAYMDADMAIDPVAVPLLLDGLASYDVAVGSRALPDSMVESTYAVRALMGRLFNQLVTTGTGLSLRDTQCGFKAFRTPVARLLFHLGTIDGFAFDVEVLTHAQRLGMSITEVPVHWRHVPGSTIHPIHDSFGMLADVYRSRLGLAKPSTVTVVFVRDRSGRRPDDGTVPRIRSALSPVTGDAPLPVLVLDAAVAVPLALVPPADTFAALGALRVALAPLEVTARPMSLRALRALGPRLQPASPDGGPAAEE
jgi:dolichyl-phosphate beta-glucosyltransferase